MALWTFDVKFPRGTEFTFGSLTFAAGEDGDLRMLPPGEATEHTAPSSASSGTQADLDFFDESYIRTVKLVRGIPVVRDPEHRFRPHRPCPPSKGHLKIIPRLGSAPAEAPRTSAASSVWWPRTKISPATAPAGTPLSGDLRLQTPELLVHD
jgi:hypothetical protein